MAITAEMLAKATKKKKSILFVWRADLERQAGKLDSALALLNEGLVDFPDLEQAQLVRSAILLEQGDLDGALDACNIVLRKNPLCLSAIRRKGDVYEAKGDVISRNHFYSLVHDIDPLDSFWKEEYTPIPQETFTEEESLKMPETEENFALPEEQPVEEDDPFAALNALMPQETVEETSVEEALSANLDNVLSTLDSIPEKEESLAQIEDIEDESVSGNDVSSAISDFFGESEEFPGEKTDSIFSQSETKQSSPFATEIPTSLEDDADVTEQSSSLFEKSSSLFEKSALSESESAAADSIQSANAFEHSDLELPTDSLSEPSMLRQETFEKSSLEQEPEATNLDDAFGSLFGEDELPEEMSSSALSESLNEGLTETEETSSLFEKSSSLFEKSALSEAEPAEAVDAVQPAESSADADLEFSSDSLQPTETVEAEPHAELAADSALHEPDLADFMPPPPALELEGDVEESLSDILGETEQKEIAMELDSKTEPNLSELLNAIDNESATEQTDEISLSSLDSLLDDSEQVESEPQSETVTSVEDQVVEEQSIEEQTEKSIDEGVSEAFASIFGDEDDDLQLSVPTPENENQAEPVVASSELDSLFNDDSDELTLDSVSAKTFSQEMQKVSETIEPLEKSKDDSLEDNLSAEVSSSLDALFGDDDDELVLPTSAETSHAEEPTNSFQTLFETEDAPEERLQGQDRVDFLLSDDSDDEISAALLKDSSASLGEVNEEIDENLKTRTLAEIYFEQGLYRKSLDIYRDLANKMPEDEQTLARLAEIEKVCDEKYGNQK